MAKKVLLLGSTGKMGMALREVFEDGYTVIGKNTRDFDALRPESIRNLVEENRPDMVINTVAFLGIDPCEREPEKALRLNTLYPRMLAELSNEKRFLLINFSTDAVFDDGARGFYTETDRPRPLNLYGFTKHGGDCFVQTISKNYYVFRLSVIFGKTTKNTQFVEKMLQKVCEGQKVLRVADDIVSSPSYSVDIAKEVRRLTEASSEFGLYHIANEGMATLYDLMNEIVKNLNLDVEVERASYKDFPYLGRKNTFTPIKSEKVAPLRPWREAVKEYCDEKLRGEVTLAR
ncbi:MAG: SDR family oxidoreductase [Candidatus Brocadiales bacterium]